MPLKIAFSCVLAKNINVVEIVNNFCFVFFDRISASLNNALHMLLEIDLSWIRMNLL